MRTPAHPLLRRWFARWACRLAAVLLPTMALTIFYLHQIGLPGFAKTWLQSELQAKGWHVKIDRLRWQSPKRLLAEGVRLQTTNADFQPRLLAEELEIRLQSLFTFPPKIASATLRNGALDWPLSATAGARTFQSTELQTKLSFPAPNCWLLENFQAQCLGVELKLQAQITNIDAIKNWRFQWGETALAQRLKIIDQIIQIIDSLEFAGTPSLQINLNADAAHPEKSTAHFELKCRQAATPGGSLRQLLLSVSIDKTATAAAGKIHSIWKLSIGHLHRPPQEIRGIQLSAEVVHDSRSAKVKSALWSLQTDAASHGAFRTSAIQIDGHTTPSTAGVFQNHLELILDGIAGPELSVEKARLSAKLAHQGVDWESVEGGGQAAAINAETAWGTASRIDVSGSFHAVETNADIDADALGPWHSLRKKQISLQAAANAIRGDFIEAENVQLRARWETPNLEVEHLSAILYGGSLDFQGTLAANTRRAKLAGHFDFDIQRIRHLLTDKGQRWLSRYEFQKPPFVQIRGSAILPEWGEPNPDWRGKVKPTLNLAGHFRTGKAAFRTVPVSAASSSIEFTNMTWRLPNLQVIRPEGELRLRYECDAETQDHRWHIDGPVNLNAWRPLMIPAQKKGLTLFKFTQPVHILGEAQGRWRVPQLTRFKTKLAATNFTFRDVPVLSLRADLAYINKLLTATHIELDRTEGGIHADLAKVNANTRLITITNAHSAANPAALLEMIGPAAERALQSCRFSKPPQIQINGIIPFDGGSRANAHFQVTGGPFAFWRFHTPRIRADVHWLGRNVQIANVIAPFYQGSLNGNMNFQLTTNRRAGFNLNADVQDADLNALFADVLSEDNQSQGILSGRIRIQSAQTDNWNNWQGNGQVRLKKGRLWDAPLFSIFSPILNAVSPGLGSSRAESGQASFAIADGAICTSDLTIQEPSARLRYQGKIDFQGNLDGTVEAKLLRNTPMIGQVVSTTLWPVSKLFVYQVSGDLQKPIVEPRYALPKLLITPLNAILNSSNISRRNLKPTPPAPASTN